MKETIDDIIQVSEDYNNKKNQGSSGTKPENIQNKKFVGNPSAMKLKTKLNSLEDEKLQELAAYMYGGRYSVEGRKMDLEDVEDEISSLSREELIHQIEGKLPALSKYLKEAKGIYNL